MPLPLFIALRFMAAARMQTALILIGVSVGVGVLVFLSALISGLQDNLIRQTLDLQAHIVIRAPDDEARRLLSPRDFEASDTGRPWIAPRVQRPPQRLRSVPRWQQVMATLAQTPGIQALAPLASGPAFAVRGPASESVLLMGIDRASFARVISIQDNMIEGSYVFGSGDVLVGVQLAEDLSMGVGDRVRIQSGDGVTQVFTIAGLFDVGNEEVNRRWVMIALRSAQTLLDLEGGVSELYLRVDRIFEARDIAERVRQQTGLRVESWMELNEQLLDALQAQDRSSRIIQLFVVLAVALGIASVLIVSVLQKIREIGILRTVGVSRASVATSFLLQGGLLGLVGSLLGCAIGAALGHLFMELDRLATGEPAFPVNLSLELYLVATLVATLTGLASAALPAVRAARVEPSVAVRSL